MTAAKVKEPTPLRSGFCGLGNPPDAHARCSGHVRQHPCKCECHQTHERAYLALNQTPEGVQAGNASGKTAPYPAGLVHDLDEATYHADRTSLSHSGAKLMLKAPALYRWRLDHPEHKDAFDFGRAAHAKVLGIGAPIRVVEADSWRTKDAQAQKTEARDAGETPLLAADARRVDAMADALASHRLAMQLLSDGRPEVSAYAVDDATGVTLRGRFDWLGARICTDFKTAASADPEEFVKAAARYGYDSQHAWYLDLLATLGEPRQAFALIAQEKEPPHLVTVVELPEELVERGRRRNRRAIERFRDCQESGQWPGYVPDDTFATPAAPRWALYEEDLIA